MYGVHMNKINDPNDFLVGTGLLFEINRIILHPIGLALAVVLPCEGKVGAIELLDGRDDKEGFYFDEIGYRLGDDKMKSYMEKQGDEAIQARFDVLGFVIQEKGGK
jgi:hypothetical protein